MRKTSPEASHFQVLSYLPVGEWKLNRSQARESGALVAKAQYPNPGNTGPRPKEGFACCFGVWVWVGAAGGQASRHNSKREGQDLAVNPGSSLDSGSEPASLAPGDRPAVAGGRGCVRRLRARCFFLQTLWGSSLLPIVGLGVWWKC